jgi:hypothetical protein
LGKAGAVGDRVAEERETPKMIIRRRRTANFTVIGNELFDDERLEADEVGILAYLRSRPDKWEVRRPALMRRWRVGRDGLKRIIHNLLRTGWMLAIRVRHPKGTWSVVYVVQDQPGPELSEEAIRQALSLVSSEAGELGGCLGELCESAWDDD